MTQPTEPAHPDDAHAQAFTRYAVQVISDYYHYVYCRDPSMAGLLSFTPQHDSGQIDIEKKTDTLGDKVFEGFIRKLKEFDLSVTYHPELNYYTVNHVDENNPTFVRGLEALEAESNYPKNKDNPEAMKAFIAKRLKRAEDKKAADGELDKDDMVERTRYKFCDGLTKGDTENYR